VLSDQASKELALRFLDERGSLALVPDIFHLTLVRNTGIAFGFFREHSALLFGLISLSLVVLFLWGLGLREAPRSARLGTALILGGAVGNWIDRMRFGAVIDFLDFRVWPVFNVADTAISAGVILYLWVLCFKKKAP
jgi:signal peptidase II